MKLQDICASLEMSKELKKAGYPQDSLFYWAKFKDVWKIRDRDAMDILFPDYEKVSAPTVAELGEALPVLVEDNYSDCYKSADGWECSYDRAMNGKFFTDKSEANVRAKMWLYLKEEGLL